MMFAKDNQYAMHHIAKDTMVNFVVETSLLTCAESQKANKSAAPCMTSRKSGQAPLHQAPTAVKAMVEMETGKFQYACSRALGKFAGSPPASGIRNYAGCPVMTKSKHHNIQKATYR